MDEKMSDKKEWREWQLRVGEMQAYVYAGDELDPKKDDYIEVIEKAAFETEKQRADRLEKETQNQKSIIIMAKDILKDFAGSRYSGDYTEYRSKEILKEIEQIEETLK